MESHIDSTAAKPGDAAHKRAQNKIDKYAKLAASTGIFYLFAFQMTGTWHGMAIELTYKITHRRIKSI